MSYSDPGAAADDEQHRKRIIANLQRRAKTLGYELASIPQVAGVSEEAEIIFGRGFR